MRRPVITGLGIISCLGNRLDTVSEALASGRSGLSHAPDYAAHGLKCQVAGIPSLAHEAAVPRTLRRFMGDVSLYAWHAAHMAINDAGLSDKLLHHQRTGVVAGSGIGSSLILGESFEKHFTKDIRKVSPYGVPQVMGSTVSANLSASFGIKGVNYSITSACSTSAHCIGHAADLIRWGAQDIVLAGGAEEASWPIAMFFDAMGALSIGFNDRPEQASRPYDKNRDGFILSGGAGMLIVEELRHARRRNARIYGEVLRYGATSDGRDMVVSQAEGVARCMSDAIKTVDRPIDYINTHATSTQQGDLEEIKAMQMVFGSNIPQFSSTKCLTGHSIGASGAQDAIYCLLMMRDSFLPGMININQIDPALKGLPLITRTKKTKLITVMSNSFGFGGSNASLVFGLVG